MEKLNIALVPSYEPSDTLVDLTGSLHDAGFEIIIVNDGSGEKYTPYFEMAARYAVILKHSINKGKGFAIKTGLEYIKDNYTNDAVVVTLDSDGQHTVNDAKRIAEYAVKNPDCLILGSRSFSKEVPLRSRFGNKMTRLVYSLSTRTRVKDTQTGLRSFSAHLIPFMLSVEGERYEYEMNVLLECSRSSIPIKEIAIETIYIDNNSGSHFNTLKDSIRIYREIIKFAASSFVSFLVDYGMYSLLILITGSLGTSLSVLLSNIFARITSASVNYSINKRFVFKHKGNYIKSAAQYFILAGLILGGNTLLLSFLVNDLYVNKFAAKIITEVTYFTLSWAVQRFVIFKKTAKKTEKKLNYDN